MLLIQMNPQVLTADQLDISRIIWPMIYWNITVYGGWKKMLRCIHFGCKNWNVSLRIIHKWRSHWLNTISCIHHIEKVRPLFLNEYYSPCDLSAVCSSFEHTPTEQTMNLQSKTNAWFLNKRSTPVKLIMVKSQSFSYHSKTPCITHIRTINFQMLALWPKKNKKPQTHQFTDVGYGRSET